VRLKTMSNGVLPEHREIIKGLAAPARADHRVFLGILACLREASLAIAEKQPEQA
jgi:hypothetical protein